MPLQYAQDLAITAVICFIGGVGLTLLVVLIYYRVSHRKKLKESKIQLEEEERSIPVINNYISHLEVSENRRDDFVQASSSQPLEKIAMMFDTRLENHGGQFWSRADEDAGHFRCLDCSTKGQRGVGLNPVRWNNRINREMEAEEERDKTRIRVMTEEERRKPETQRGFLSRDRLLTPGNSNSSPHPWKETFETPVTLSAYKTGRDMDSYRTGVEGKSSGHETFHCDSCHRTYRPSEQTMRSGKIHTSMRDSVLFDSFPPQHRLIEKARNVNHNQFDLMKNPEIRRESRNVKFDLEYLRTLEQENIHGEDKREEKARTSRDEKKGQKKRHNVKIQSNGLLKVKLNLSPLQKSRVHPKRKNEQGHSDKSSYKKSKEKKQNGKEREEKKVFGKKTKVSSEKMKKSTKRTGSSDEEKVEEDRGGGNSKTTLKQKNKTSKSEQGCKENTAYQDENTHPDIIQSGDTTSIADQSASAIATSQGQNLKAGLVLGNAQLCSQQPLSLPAVERNTNLSLLGSAGSPLTGSSLSLQGGSILFNTIAPGSDALFPNEPANSIACGPNLTSSGALESFSRQTGVSFMSPLTSRLANTVHANHLQASAIQTAPLHTSQAGGFAPNLAENSAIYPSLIQSLSQSQLPPDSPALVPRLKHDPAQGPGLRTVEGLHQLPPELQAFHTKESLPVQAQAPNTDGLSGVTSQAVGSVTTLENLSNNNSQTGIRRVPDGSTVNILTGGVVLTEGPVVGVSGDGMHTANVSVSGVSEPSTSTQSGSSTGGAALLQHEYMSEEGGSSQRRKLKLVLPEKTSSRLPTSLERKIR
ncbi:uncharacterized protein LOC130178600 [Seriola aureovittata]|uniref:uncharacterized protein LOC130178600 n=1 Tax=Seriola aureovittata TaxID=2871759 RepID=UPI0024BDC7B8|nr:uncharacterized protein LOC130178600 [Seriola aureovittata]